MHLNLLRRYIARMTDLRNILIVNVLCLCINLFFVVLHVDKGVWPVESFFPQNLNSRDQALMLRTLKDLMDVCEKHNLTYFLYAGSMLGSYRHHNLIPWDDDCDIMFNGSQKHRLKSVLGNIEGYRLYSQDEADFDKYGPWKFYSVESRSFFHRPFAWPYIDVFFFRENSTHLWDEIPKYGEAFTKRKKKIFPLQRRPFGSLNVPAPCDIEHAIEGVFDPDQCQSPHFNHMFEMPAFSFNQRLVPCHRLQHRYPFVQHRKLRDGSYNESLMLAGFTLWTKRISRCQKT